ncbi:MAG: response regulator transcription factor, partial [Anaerolineae bacterium]|nr:response regulator transcription factor [Anaerolineae bacterium]
MHEGEPYVLESLKSGATGYALKQSGANDLIQAVHEVAAGRRYLSPTLSERAIDAYMNLQHDQDATLNIYGSLTRREREVLQWVVDGLTSAEIGQRLGISPRTVEKHRANMMQKLGVRNQADLVRYALQHGFVASE